jgi:hypothetical protein
MNARLIDMRKWIVFALVVALAVPPALATASRPASALTPNENFIAHVHRDFLLREASANEFTWWSAYLSSGSRAVMMESIFDSSEFKTTWIYGVRQYYLGEIDFQDPQIPSDLSDLNSTDDYVGAEVDVLARSEYFALHGGTNTGFVEGLYTDVLLRSSDPAGLTYWVNRINSGVSTRAQAATTFIRSSEAASRRVSGAPGQSACAADELSDDDALAAGSFCIVLDRLADPSGAAYWSGQLTGSGQLPELWASLGASSEYFSNAQG